jgi:hypothetical protein
MMADPYLGEIMHMCPIKPFEFKMTRAVIVSGMIGNFCGHCILYTGGGWYFHVDGDNNRPWFMREEGYMRYLKENKRHEYRRWIIQIPNPAGAHAKLEELLTQQWRWLGLKHNCVSFVEEVVEAGGSNAGMYFNCPAAEPFA